MPADPAMDIRWSPSTGGVYMINRVGMTLRADTWALLLTSTDMPADAARLVLEPASCDGPHTFCSCPCHGRGPT